MSVFARVCRKALLVIIIFLPAKTLEAEILHEIDMEGGGRTLVSTINHSSINETSMYCKPSGAIQKDLVGPEKSYRLLINSVETQLTKYAVEKITVGEVSIFEKPKVQIKILKIEDESDWAACLSLSKLFLSWVDEKTDNSLIELEKKYLSLIEDSSLTTSFRITTIIHFSAFLYATEKYHQLIDLDKYIILFDIENELLADTTIFYDSLRAKTSMSLRDFEEASKQYKALVDQYQIKVKNASQELIEASFWRYMLEEAKANYGEALFIHAHNTKNTQQVADAEAVLKSAEVNLLAMNEFRILGNVQNIYSFLLWNSKRKDLAIEKLESAIKNHRKVGESTDLVSVLNSAAVFKNWKGEKGNAIRSLSEAIFMQKKIGDNSRKGYLSANLSDLYFSIGEYDSAEMAILEAGKEFTEVRSRKGIAVVSFVLAKIAYAKGSFNQATSYLNEALGIYKEDPEQNQLLIVHGRALQARIHFGQNNVDEARNTLNSMPGFIESMLRHYYQGDYVDEAKLLDILLAHYETIVAIGDDARVHVYESHFDNIFTSNNNARVYPIKYLDFLSVKLNSRSKTSDFERIESIVDQAFSLREFLVNNIDSDLFTVALGRKFDRIYRSYIKILLDDNNLKNSTAKDILTFLEYTSSKVLIHTRSSVLAGYDISEPNDPPIPSSLSANEEILITQNLGITDEERDKNFVGLAEERAKSLTIYKRDIITGTKDDQKEHIERLVTFSQGTPKITYLRFFLRDDLTIVVWLKNGRIKYKKLGRLKVLRELIADFRLKIESQDNRYKSVAFDISQWLKLNELGIRPFDRIVIVPDGILHELPFDAVSIAEPGEKFVRTIDQNIVTVLTPSLSSYVQNNVASFSGGYISDIAIFADPIFEAGIISPSESYGSYRNWMEGLGRLPWTGEEAEKIVDMFPDQTVAVRVRDQATQAALFSSTMRHSKLLHIASHGYFSNSTPGISGIAVAAAKSTPEIKSNFVSLSELLSSRFLSNLVVISGCETSLGEDYGNEGNYGLVWGLISRGAGSVIGSLWSVSDRGTAKFMERFYFHLSSSSGNSAYSLAAAKIDMAKDERYSHPVFWSGFVLTSINTKYDSSVFK